MLNVNVSNPKALQTAIESVAKFANNQPHNTLPTRNVLVETTHNGLRLTATDLLTAVELPVNSSEVNGTGEFCLKAQTLRKIGKIVKDQSAIGLEATETGVNLTLLDAPTFVAKFETSKTDEFPMLPDTDPKAHWIELDPEHIAILRKLVKYANPKERGRVGFDAVQFGMPASPDDDNLYAYTTDGKTLAFAKLGRTAKLPNFAAPLEAVKKALQVSNTPNLKTSAWRITLPTKVSDLVSIQAADTSVKVKAGDSIDLTEWIERHVSYNGDDDDYIAFNPTALKNGLKKVSKLFSKEKKHTNVVVIEGNQDGNHITMTAEVYKKSISYSRMKMDAEYVHSFDATEAEVVTSANHWKILVDGNKLQSIVTDLAGFKPNVISVNAKYGIPDTDGASRYDAVVISGADSPLQFITNPLKL